MTALPQDPHQVGEQRGLGSGGLGSSHSFVQISCAKWTGHSAPHGLNILIHKLRSVALLPANVPRRTYKQFLIAGEEH